MPAPLPPSTLARPGRPRPPRVAPAGPPGPDAGGPAGARRPRPVAGSPGAGAPGRAGGSAPTDRAAGAHRTDQAELVELAARAAAAGRAAGLDAVGVAPAEPLEGTRRDLEERKAAGLHGGMGFTYRNPARSTDPAAVLPGARALVAGAHSYRGGPVPAPPGGAPHGQVARYAWDDHYAALERGLGAVADVLRAGGWRAVVVADQNHLVDRAVAHRAGLGWYGKSSLLLLPGAGSWFVLGAVVTDAPLASTAPAPVPDGCGPCTRCVADCPTGAIVAPGVVDARRCLAWIVQAPGPVPREHRVALGGRIYGCDACQDACPPNRIELRRRTPAVGAAPSPGPGAGGTPGLDPGPGPDASGRRTPGAGAGSGAAAGGGGPAGRAWVDLLDLLAADDATLLDRHGRWYIADRDPRWLRRNALVALGNVAAPADRRVAGALTRALAGPDPLLAAHAAWAARRLGRDDLLAAAGTDPAPEVREELAAPAPPPR